ncbi:unnamed protein product [Calypogeia fissa]
MAGVIGTQPGAVRSATAVSRPAALSSSASGKSLAFVGSKEVRGDDLFPRSGKNSSSPRVQTAGPGTSFQVQASSLISDLIGKIVPHSDNQNTVTYTGVAIIAKKRAELTNLVQLDVVDGQAAIEDQAADVLGQKIEIKLVSKDLDPKTNAPYVSEKSHLENWLTTGDFDLVADDQEYPIKFSVPKDFGQPGAIIVRNNHPNEFYIKSLRLEAEDKSVIEFLTYAWIYNAKKYAKDRVFFTNELHLPADTPPGLKAFREQELEQIRGDGTGERQPWERIYDYDTYDDLGNPDKDMALDRPPLGGSKDLPYPRRVRSGRPMTKTDPKTESLPPNSSLTLPYIPTDEYFLRTKNSTFISVLIKGVLQSVIPTIEQDGQASFKSFEAIKDLYTKGPEVDLDKEERKVLKKPQADVDQRGDLVYLSTLFEAAGEDTSVVNFALPQVIAADENAWKMDEEYGREALAGLHPNVIQGMPAFPPTSALDPAEYGEATALTDKDILPYLEGLSVKQAVQEKRLFTIDYHDAILPFLNEVNADTKAGFQGYAPRSIFFHTKAGTVKVIAIELSLPPAQKGGKAANRVFTPADAADHLWDLAKFHAGAIDSNYHQVISHFTFAHASMEPIIIAANRQLSEMHPIRTLMKPYFKDTISINAAARAVLINAGGNVESNFTMGKYAFQVGAKGYGANWRFDQQGLPQNLVARGMAEPADSSYPGSVKLVIEDYPYAKDGLEIWDAVYKWVAKYVEIIYQGSDEAIKEDTELQAWWNEIRTVGHGDLKDAPWWPKLDSAKNLVQVITTIAWVAGPFHAALNFGQYAYAGYPLNKPSGTRKFVPEKGSAEYDELQKDPETFILSTICAASQAMSVMLTIELLATHSADEVYIGTQNSPDWTADPRTKAAFQEFSERIAAVEENIMKRNEDPALVNRTGPAKLPYTLLVPSSTSGMTGRGVPNSVSI